MQPLVMWYGWRKCPRKDAKAAFMPRQSTDTFWTKTLSGQQIVATLNPKALAVAYQRFASWP